MLIKFLLEDILNFHSQLEDKSTGVRDLGLIESAVNAPFQTFGGQDLYPTIFDKAAQLAYGLTENHGFVDGNKRAAIHSMMVYLLLNDLDLTVDEDEIFQVSMRLAAGKISSAELSEWLKHNTIKIHKGESFMKSEFTLKLERCKGCGICVTFCPKQVLALDTLGKVYIANHENCIACGQCELRCPDYAIFMDKVKPAKEAAK